MMNDSGTLVWMLTDEGIDESWTPYEAMLTQMWQKTDVSIRREMKKQCFVIIFATLDYSEQHLQQVMLGPLFKAMPSMIGFETNRKSNKYHQLNEAHDIVAHEIR